MASIHNIVNHMFKSSLGFRYEHRRYKDLARQAVALCGNELLPHQSETCAFSVSMQKTAALAYDRVWGTPPAGVPEYLFFIGETEEEVSATTAHVIVTSIGHDFLDGKLSKDDFIDIGISVIECYTGISQSRDKWLSPSENKISLEETYGRKIAESIAKKYGLVVTPIYQSTDSRDRCFTVGDHNVAIASLQNLEIVSEHDLEWQQVVEFREDTDARDKYRRFIHWLDKEMVGKPQTFIEDSIALKLEDYHHALKTHGIKTRIGLLSGIFDWKFLTAGAAVGSSLTTTTGDTLLGLLSGAGCVIGSVICQLKKAKIDLEELRQSYQEIAFVHEVKEKLGSKNSSSLPSPDSGLSK